MSDVAVSSAVNLPPTLANSQVSSVRKSLKLQMLSVLKHPAAADMISQIATLLTDLGATQSEVNKAMPKQSDLAASRKRKAEQEAANARSKKSTKTEVITVVFPFPGLCYVMSLWCWVILSPWKLWKDSPRILRQFLKTSYPEQF